MATEVKRLYVPKDNILPDNDQWKHRFEVESFSSDNVYIVSQNKSNKHMGCSCPGFKRWRKCKHLQTLGFPIGETPYELDIEIIPV